MFNSSKWSDADMFYEGLKTSGTSLAAVKKPEEMKAAIIEELGMEKINNEYYRRH